MIAARILLACAVAAATSFGPGAAAVLAGNAAGEATVSADTPAALLVFPLIRVDESTGTDSLIQLTNTGEDAVAVHCLYNEPMGDPTFREFDIRLAGNQPVAWRAGAGLAAVPGEGGTIPALGAGPYTGLLRCLAVDDGGLPADRNVLVGSAALQRFSNTPVLIVDAAQYNATGFEAIAGASNGDRQLTLGGEAAEYAACPEALSLQTLLDGAIVDLGADGAVQHELSTTLALITCAQSPAGGGGATINLAVTDELGFTLSTSIALPEQRVGLISLIDTSVPSNSIFSARSTLAGNIRIRPTSTSNGVLAVAIQAHTDPNDATRVHTTAIRPQLVGERSAADIVDLVIPTPVPACVGDCDGSETVQINELVTGVNIALGETALSVCEAFDRDASGGVAISELIAAVNNALGGCS